MEQTVGRFTFAKIDTSSDVWLWSIVTDYEGSQDYGEIICSFDESDLPTALVVKIILDALYFEYDTGNYEIKDLI